MEREIDLIIDNIDELRALVVAMGEDAASKGVVHRLTLDKANKIVKLITNYNSDSSIVNSKPLKEVAAPIIEKSNPIVPPLELDEDLVDDYEEDLRDEVTEVMPDPVSVVETIMEDVKSIETPLEEINLKVLGDKVNSSSTSDSVIFKKIGDIRELISLNDRFLFLRELFGGNSMLMDQTLDQINSMSNFEECSEMLTNIFDWDVESESAKYFFTLITQRFR
ncbi:MAG: hypothetical protein ACRCZM_07430 [Bacteroidales bacterium]